MQSIVSDDALEEEPSLDEGGLDRTGVELSGNEVPHIPINSRPFKKLYGCPPLEFPESLLRGLALEAAVSLTWGQLCQMTQSYLPSHGEDALEPNKLGSACANSELREDDQEDAGMIAKAAKQPLAEETQPRSFWIACGVLVHLAWGTYPVFARYMQVMLHLDGLLVLIFSNLLSFLVVQTLTCQGLGGPAGRKVGMIYAMLITARGVSNMLTSKFTIALYSGIVTQFGPFIVAGVSWAILADDLPRCILPSLVLSTVGSLLVVLGQANSHVWEFSGNDAIGIGMAMASICVSAGIRVTMKMSSSSLSGFMLVTWQYMSAIPQVLLAMLLTPTTAWVETVHLSSHQWLVIAAFVLVLPLAASYGQVSGSLLKTILHVHEHVNPMNEYQDGPF